MVRNVSSDSSHLLFLLSPSPARFGDAAELCNQLMIVVSWLFMVVTFPFSLIFAVKWVQEYERAVVYRLGRSLPGALRGPGIFFIVPCTDTYEKIDMRTQNFIVPPQDVSYHCIPLALAGLLLYPGLLRSSRRTASRYT